MTTVLDGGLSNALVARGHDLADRLWTARLLRDAPGEVAEVHRAYYKAGAQVATTASYQASVDGFARARVTLRVMSRSDSARSRPARANPSTLAW